MPRGKRVTTTVVDVKPDKDEVDLSEYLKGLAGSGITVKLYRTNRLNQQCFLEIMPMEAIETGQLESLIREKHGGGSYLIRAVRDGKFLTNGTRTIHIADDDDEAAPVAPQSDNARMFELQIAMMKDSADRQFQMMSSFNTSIMTVLTALITSNKPLDPLQLASLLKDGSNPTGQLAMMKEMVSFAKELSPGGGEPEDPWMKVLTMVPQILGNRAAAQIPAELPKENPPVVQQTAVEAQPVDERKRFLLQLKEKAKAGKDVAFWADYIEENPDEPGPAVVLGFVRMYSWEEVFAALCHADPDIANEPCKAWFEQLYVLLKEPVQEGKQ